VSSGARTGLGFTIEIEATGDLAEDANRVEAQITIQATGLPSGTGEQPRRPRRTFLRLRLGDGFGIAAVVQTYPAQADLTHRGRPASGTVIDFPLGTWEGQTTGRYQVALGFAPEAIPTGQKLQAVRVDLLVERADGRRDPRVYAPLTVVRHATPRFEAAIPASRGDRGGAGYSGHSPG
jgi:hypothetical protein